MAGRGLPGVQQIRNGVVRGPGYIRKGCVLECLSDKGDFGKICIIAGSVGMSGAAALAGRAALRSGAGLVRVATPKSVLPIVASIEPSFTTIDLPEDSTGRISAKAINTILDAVNENDVFAFGPGVGVSGGLQSILQTLQSESLIYLLI